MTQPPNDRMPPPSEPVEPTPGDEPVDQTPESADQTAEPEQPAPSEEKTPAPEQPAPAEEETTAPDAPTVAWTPPGAEGPPPEPPPPPSPIISADTSTEPPPSGWQVPGTPPPVPAAVSGGGWEVPPTPAPTAQQEGYVVAGAGARFVAWLIDLVLAAIVPGAIFLLVVDWVGFFRTIFDQIQFDASGRFIQNYNYTFTFPITLDVVLAFLILIGVQFLYFVGFWTSRWQATPGMIGLKMRVVDANTGAGLTLMQAAKRWFAMGWWLSLLFLVPVLQNAASLAQFAVNVFLFFSTVTDDRRRGFHDKFAGSQVIRSVTSGSGATIVGCLVYIVMIILLSVVVWIVLFTALLPESQRLIQEYPRNAT